MTFPNAAPHIPNMPTDAELIEASLAAAADVDLNGPLYAKFFATYPDRAPAFTNLEASAPRMTDETLQMMHGLATGATWVWPLIAELTFTHRNYGSIPHSEYEAFIAMTIDALADAVGDGWDAATDAAWRRQGDVLYAKIVEAREGWAMAMPGGPVLVA